MTKKISRKNQKIYRMKGCSKTRKNYLGGDNNLAYPSNNVPKVPNPFLAYTGKGGSNLNAAYPNPGPPSDGFNFLNPLGSQRGGSCGCSLPLMSGGSRSLGSQRGGSCGCSLPLMRGGCGPLCAASAMVAGGKHRYGCKCSLCISKKGKKEKKGMKGGNPGIPYPDGLVGKPWTPSIGGWPGVDGISGNRNYLANNNYHTDISRQMIATGANPPFSVGGKRKQKGGALSNFMGQDFINLGRQLQFGLGSAYNALSGYPAPTNPLPWKDQMPRSLDLSTLKAAI